MPSENYRYYCIDSTGHLHGASWFEAENDADAIAQITVQHPEAKFEIWQSRRLVACVEPKRLRA